MIDGLSYRSAELAAVSFPNRTIELIVMPYETETTISEHGRVFTEIVSRGAFDGIESRNAKVRVNRDHDRQRSVGRAVAFHPSRQEGLVAEIRISNTPLGEETLVLADDGVLDASAGFAPMRDKNNQIVQDALVWETKNRVRLNHLYLDHIAMTPDPAYKTAEVLAVRQAGPPVAAPNRARIELDEWREKLAILDKRYASL